MSGRVLPDEVELNYVHGRGVCLALKVVLQYILPKCCCAQYICRYSNEPCVGAAIVGVTQGITSSVNTTIKDIVQQHDGSWHSVKLCHGMTNRESEGMEGMMLCSSIAGAHECKIISRYEE